MSIRRHLEDEVYQLILQFPVVAIVGARQVGKTTLAKTLRERLPKASVYLDLESPQDVNKLRDAEQYLMLNEDETVILDEIQRLPELFAVLRSLIDRKREPGRFIILGSASPELLRQSSESLAGRIAYVEMQPVLLDELPGIDFRPHWLYGGYPVVVTTSDLTFKQNWIRNFIRTYIERDLAVLGLNIESLRLQRLLLLLAGMNGMQINKSTLAKSLQISVPTISRYLDFLEGAFLLRIMQPYFTNIRKRVSKTPKLYFTDTGILHGIMAIEDMNALFSFPEVGHSWECYSIQQIVSVLRGRKEIFYYQTQSGAEVDLLVTSGGVPVATFEMKFSVAPEIRRGNKEAISALGSPKNYIVSPIDDAYPIMENVQVVGIRQAIEIAREL